MGTTKTALETRDAVELVWTLAIEGFDYVLTSGSPAKTVTAWSSSAWSQALPGLSVIGTFEQRWQPFGNDLEVHRIQCRVIPDPDDTFGIAVFKSKPTYTAKLTADFTPGDTTINVKNTTLAPSTGTVSIGTKTYAYTGKTTTTLTGVTSVFAPLEANTLSTGEFPGVHLVTSPDMVMAPENKSAPNVSDVHTAWVGRTAALYLHRVNSGVYDVVAQAHLQIAGQIASIYEGEDGTTVLEIEDFRQKIADTIILQDQWTADVVEGIYINAGTWFSALWLSGTDNWQYTTSDLTCVVGASGADEFEPGLYSPEQVLELISDWLNNDTAAVDATDGARWRVEIVSTTSGLRSMLQCDLRTTGRTARLSLHCTTSRIFRFLGFTTILPGSPSYDLVRSEEAEDISQIISDEEPYRSNSLFDATASADGPDLSNIRIDYSNESGSYLETTDLLPPEIANEVAAAESWGLFAVNKAVIVARKNNGYLDRCRAVHFMQDASALQEIVAGRKYGAEALFLKQIVAISGTLGDVLTKLLASTDGSGTNHATYDSYPFGAAIPWGILGTNWLNSLADIEQTSATDSILIIVRKPQSIWNLIKADLMVRSAFFAWKDSGIQLQSFQTPNANEADWTLDETTKGVTPGQSSRPESRVTQEWLVNSIKLFYNLNGAGEYTKEMVIRDVESIQSHGLAKPVEIKLANTYEARKETGDSIEVVAEFIAARLMPPMARPMRVWRVPINHKLFGMVPGDTVAFTDDHARDPTTGRRGVAVRGCTCLAVSYSYGVSAGPGQMHGSAELLFSEEEREFPLSPAAEHDETYTSGTYTDGWSSSNLRLATKQNQYSTSGDDPDATRFADGDAVFVVEIDPADPSSADIFEDTIDGTPSSSAPYYLQLTVGFGSGGNPSFSSSKIYRVIPAKYADAESSQLDTAFIADDADGLIQDTIEPNSFGDDRILASTAADITALPSFHVDEYFGEGMPLHPGLLYDQAAMVNNLTNYKMAPNATLMTDVASQGVSVTAGSVIYTIPIYIGHLRAPGNRPPTGSLSLCFCSSTNGVETRITVTSSAEPFSGDNWDSLASGVLRGPQTSVTFSTTSGTKWVHTDPQDLKLIRSTLYPGLTFLTFQADVIGTSLEYNGFQMHIKAWGA